MSYFFFFLRKILSSVCFKASHILYLSADVIILWPVRWLPLVGYCEPNLRGLSFVNPSGVAER